VSDYYSESVADLPLFRRADPVTSKIAGTMAREFKGDHERRILEALARGPATKTEIADRTGVLTEQQVARRMHGLMVKGAVEPTGVDRKSQSGCPEREWRLTK
jgi:transcription initiation factor IIE alpha subunit